MVGLTRLYCKQDNKIWIEDCQKTEVRPQVLRLKKQGVVIYHREFV